MTNPYKQAILDKIEALEESVCQAQSFIIKKRQTQEELKCILESAEKGAMPVPEESEPPVIIEKEEVKGHRCPKCKAFPATFIAVQGGLQCACCSGMVWVWVGDTPKGATLLEEATRTFFVKPDVEPPVEEEPVVEEVKLGQCPRCMQYPVDFEPVQGGLQCSSCWGMVWYDSTTKGVALRAENEEAKNV